MTSEPRQNSAQSTRQIRVTDEQFKLLFDAAPHDPELQAEACRDALFGIYVPNQKGRWPKYDVRVYYDNGFHGSGYLMVHWEDHAKVPGCLSNGYCTDPDLRDDNIVWDDQPERERLQAIKDALWERAYG